MKLFIKICGITRTADALCAAAHGADAIGLNFFSGSPRCVGLETAAEICRALPSHVLKTGLFVNASRDEIRRCDEQCRFDLIQLHGDEGPEECLAWGGRAVRAVRLRSEADLGVVAALRGVGMIVCDAAVPGVYGGTGQRADWELARRVVGFGIPVLLAGGLTPDNVAEAVRAVRPYGVDVAGGVESAPGIKDPGKVAAFICAAREAANAL